MASRKNFDRIWDIIEKVGVCMLTTQSSRGLRARPVESRPDRKAGLIWFVTDRRSAKEHEIESEHDVGLVFIDAKAKAYLSITARAEVLGDHAKAAEIWKKTDDLWWKGPDDPNVCVLRVTPLTAELWDGPSSSAVAVYEIAKAKITGTKPNLGENRKITAAMAPSEKYTAVWRAARERKQITFTYKGKPREAFPVIVGYGANDAEATFAYQTGGATRGSKLPGWRGFYLADAENIKLRTGTWSEGTSHKKAQTFVRKVDVDVNIPGTLKRQAPLPSYSPELRPPRT